MSAYGIRALFLTLNIAYLTTSTSKALLRLVKVKLIFYLFKSDFLKYVFKYEFMEHMSFMKVNQENNHLFLIEWLVIFCSFHTN